MSLPPKKDATDLHSLITTRIAQSGPMTVAQYMAECLLHPTKGYYTTRAPFGAAGDFVTAPEISQMFGELIGLCLAQSWLDQGSPDRFSLAELGPGRGTLMVDALRAAQKVPGFVEAADIVMVEASDNLAAIQRASLGAYSVSWINSAEGLADQPLFLIANEFFDALPIRQFQRSGEHWRERQIGQTQGRLHFGLAPAGPHLTIDHRLKDTKDGDIVEYAPSASMIVHSVGQKINDHGGAALIIDYGDWRALGDTLQAVAAHEQTDPLINPGGADLTAHVDFEALALAVPCSYTRLTPQGVFLERLGITARAQMLAQTLQGAALDTHVAAHRRLTHGDEMGNLFKVMGLFPSSAPPPP
ncbi:MAG: SAM-dependent methyltransferase, partial [Sulfitobacter sp.]